MQAETKIVFLGPMGAGKTTAIAAISDIPPVNTDVANNDRATFDKDTTTTALDYGQITLDGGDVVRLYGAPGQDRFIIMRKILVNGAVGAVVLVDASQADALVQMDRYLEMLRAGDAAPALVIGVGRAELAQAIAVERFVHRLEREGLNIPVFSVDVRRREDVVLLIEALLCQLEAGAMEAAA